MVQSIIRSKPSRLFLILAGFFIANALIAEFMGVKIFSLEDSLGIHRANINLFGSSFSFHLTAGVLLWPVVFVMTDIINEYYGRKGVRFLSFLTMRTILKRASFTWKTKVTTILQLLPYLTLHWAGGL